MGRKPRDRRELGFFDHLDELRARIIRSLLYITGGAAVGWTWREPLLDFLRRPAEIGAARVGIEDLPFRVFEPVGGFMIAVQVALLTGLVAAAPLILWEIWRFIEPALDDDERRYAVLIVPFASLLFLGGVAFCYVVSPNAFAFLFNIDMSLGVDVERTLQPYLWFMMRLMLAFGLAFELPLVLMFLGFVGVVDSKRLLNWWRQAVVLIFLFAAIVTPTVDPVNMTILAVPLVMLYMLSIGLVRLVQRDKSERGKAGQEEEFDLADSEGVAPDDDPYAVYAEAEAAREEAEAPSRDDDEPAATDADDTDAVPPPREDDERPPLDP